MNQVKHFLTLALPFAFITVGVSSHAFAYDLDCKTQDGQFAAHIVADGADGSLDLLVIHAFGKTYGENSIATPWKQWAPSYQVDDNVVKAAWLMNDRSTFQFNLKSARNLYRGTFTAQVPNQAPVVNAMICQ